MGVLYHLFCLPVHFACTPMFEVDEVHLDVTRILGTAEFVFRVIFPLKISLSRIQPSCVLLILQVSLSADNFGMCLLDGRTQEYPYCTQNLFSLKDSVTGSRPQSPFWYTIHFKGTVHSKKQNYMYPL